MTGPTGASQAHHDRHHEHPDDGLSILIVDDHRILADVLALRLGADDRVRRVDAVSTLAAAKQNSSPASCAVGKAETAGSRRGCSCSTAWKFVPPKPNELTPARRAWSRPTQGRSSVLR